MEIGERQDMIEQARAMIAAIEFCEDLDFADYILDAILNCSYIPDAED